MCGFERRRNVIVSRAPPAVSAPAPTSVLASWSSRSTVLSEGEKLRVQDSLEDCFTTLLCRLTFSPWTTWCTCCFKFCQKELSCPYRMPVRRQKRRCTYCLKIKCLKSTLVRKLLHRPSRSLEKKRQNESEVAMPYCYMSKLLRNCRRSMK